MPGTNGRIDGIPIISQRLLTLPEAAHYLGCTLWSVRELIWKGALPYTRFGKRFQVDRRDLDELVDREKRCEGPGAANRQIPENARGVAKTSNTTVAHSSSEEREDETSVRKGKNQHARLGV